MKATLATTLCAAAAMFLSIPAEAQSSCGVPSAYNGTCFAGQTTTSHTVVSAESTNGNGVYATDTANGTGVSGSSYSGAGVYGECESGSCVAVSAYNGGSGWGAYAEATANDAGHFVSDSGGHDGVWASGYYAGVYGQDSSGTSIGVVGYSSGGKGVYGYTSSGYGVYGNTDSGYGIYGNAEDGGWAGYFATGNVNIDNDLYVTNIYASSCSGCTSDVRLKKNVEPLRGALGRLLQLKGVTFEWKTPLEHIHEADRGEGTQIGFVAQDVETVFPSMVKEDGYTAPDGQKYKTLELRQIEALEVESIRELKTLHDEDQPRIAALEKRLDELTNGRDPVTGGVGVGRGTLLMGGLGVLGLFGISRRKKSEKQA